MPWNTGWENGGAPILSSLQVAPGDPGIDTSAAGTLTIGETNATLIDLDAPAMLVGALTLAGTTVGVGIGISSDGTSTMVGAAIGGGNAYLRPFGVGSASQQLIVTSLGELHWSGHLVSEAVGAPVSSTLGANVTSVTFIGNDTRGTITIVMSAGLAANTKVSTNTFALSYGATGPKITLVDQTSTAGLAIVNSYVLAQATGVSFDLAFDQALVAGTYIIDYIVIG